MAYSFLFIWKCWMECNEYWMNNLIMRFKHLFMYKLGFIKRNCRTWIFIFCRLIIYRFNLAGEDLFFFNQTWWHVLGKFCWNGDCIFLTKKWMEEILIWWNQKKLYHLRYIYYVMLCVLLNEFYVSFNNISCIVKKSILWGCV